MLPSPHTHTHIHLELSLEPKGIHRAVCVVFASVGYMRVVQQWDVLLLCCGGPSYRTPTTPELKEWAADKEQRLCKPRLHTDSHRLLYRHQNHMGVVYF